MDEILININDNLIQMKNSQEQYYNQSTTTSALIAHDIQVINTNLVLNNTLLIVILVLLTYKFARRLRK